MLDIMKLINKKKRIFVFVKGTYISINQSGEKMPKIIKLAQNSFKFVDTFYGYYVLGKARRK